MKQWPPMALLKLGWEVEEVSFSLGELLSLSNLSSWKAEKHPTSRAYPREAVVRIRLLFWDEECVLPVLLGYSPSVRKPATRLMSGEMQEVIRNQSKSSKTCTQSMHPRTQICFHPSYLSWGQVKEVMTLYPEWKGWKQSCLGPVPLWGSGNDLGSQTEEHLTKSPFSELD